jgi:putative hydrolase of the HAD superfamily
VVRYPGAVLFDFYGTLSRALRADSRRPVADALGCPLERLTAVLAESFYERAIGRHGDETQTMRWVCGRLGIALDDDVLHRAVQARRAAEFANLGLRPDAVPVLSELRRRGLRTGVVSDCTHELPAYWPGLPIAGLVEATAFSIEVGACKPDPRIYLAATDALGLAPSRCLYVGDGGSGELTGARALGMAAVRLAADDGHEHVAHRREDGWRGPVIGSLADLLAMAPAADPAR